MQHGRPVRSYEPNILSNPLTHFGIHTPRGWRIHRKRWGSAKRVAMQVKGDGSRTFFPNVLRDPETNTVRWQDDLHLADDPFTDAGIYPCDPRVEYPVGRPRWAVSHTLLCFPFADHGLFTHEYTWDLYPGHLQTHFRERVFVEATTDAGDGSTIQLPTPISQPIEGNVRYALPCSAVRGVWTNPEKVGANLYTTRSTSVVRMHNAVYGFAPITPVTNVLGIYSLSDVELNKLSHGQISRTELELLSIPFDIPKLGMIRPAYRKVFSACYGTEVSMPATIDATVDEILVKQIQTRIGARFDANSVGFAGSGAVGQDAIGYAGYDPAYDLNSDDVIDEADVQLARAHLGRRVRHNHYLSAYFGGDWFSTGCLLAPEHVPGIPIILDYEHGAGYNAEAGIVNLPDSPGPNRAVWVDYFRDVPAAADEEMRIHLYVEI